MSVDISGKNCICEFAPSQIANLEPVVVVCPIATFSLLSIVIAVALDWSSIPVLKRVLLLLLLPFVFISCLKV